MVPRPPTRRRAVRLQPEAQALLVQALNESWSKSPGPGKFTREEKAERMGVSLATSNKILRGEGADRTTWEYVFMRLGVGWSDSYCMDPSSPEGVARLDLSPGDDQTNPRPTWFPVVAAGIAIIAILAAASGMMKGPVRELYDWRGEFNNQISLAEMAYHRADFAEAERLTDSAVKLARERENASCLADSLRMAGDVQSGKGDFAAAKGRYEEALRIREALLQINSRPALFEALGNTELKLNNIDAAEKAFKASREGFIKSKDPNGVVMAMRGLGSVAHRRGKLDDASEWFRKCHSIAREHGQHPMIADVAARQALVLRDRNQLNEAAGLLQICLTYWTSVRHARWIAKTRLELATVELRQGRTALAESRLLQSETAYLRIGDLAGAADAKALLAAARQ